QGRSVDQHRRDRKGGARLQGRRGLRLRKTHRLSSRHGGNKISLEPGPWWDQVSLWDRVSREAASLVGPGVSWDRVSDPVSRSKTRGLRIPACYRSARRFNDVCRIATAWRMVAS